MSMSISAFRAASRASLSLPECSGDRISASERVEAVVTSRYEIWVGRTSSNGIANHEQLLPRRLAGVSSGLASGTCEVPVNIHYISSLRVSY